MFVKEGVITRGLIIAGTNSGAGKTTITLGLMAALARRGLKVAPFKVGPDFIDPGHHRIAAGRESCNLDGWMLTKAYNRSLFCQNAVSADIVVVEGVMGLFDGFSGHDEAGSTAQMAKWLNLPVVLVVNGASMARSVAALVQGFERFDPEVSFTGVIVNRLGSPGHLEYIREALRAYVKTPFLGGLVRDERLKMPERHLGLVTAEDRPLNKQQLTVLADCIESALNLDPLLDRLPELDVANEGSPTPKNPTGRNVSIGVAQDPAFCFYYPENLRLLEQAGAELVPFSPLTDNKLPDGISGIYLGGGYPELHAERLSQNRALREAILACSHEKMPIYGECGGFMYLCRTITDLDGKSHSMCGCFPFKTRMHAKLKALGYRQVQLNADTLLGRQGETIKGHEFHYSDRVVDDSVEKINTTYIVSSRKGDRPREEGHQVRNTLGSYVHLHFGSHRESATAFVRMCDLYQNKRV